MGHAPVYSCPAQHFCWKGQDRVIPGSEVTVEKSETFLVTYKHPFLFPPLLLSPHLGPLPIAA